MKPWIKKANGLNEENMFNNFKVTLNQLGDGETYTKRSEMMGLWLNEDLSNSH